MYGFIKFLSLVLASTTIGTFTGCVHNNTYIDLSSYTEMEATVWRMAKKRQCDEIWDYTFPLAVEGSPKLQKFC